MQAACDCLQGMGKKDASNTLELLCGMDAVKAGARPTHELDGQDDLQRDAVVGAAAVTPIVPAKDEN
eukprot:7941864-Prorocentrum_lima.AAC.1